MLIKLYSDNTNQRDLQKIVAALQDGKTVIYPTDTIYGIGCDALNARAVEKICEIKGIDPKKSNLSIICNDLSNISEYAKVSNANFKLMRRNLPGPFTFILPTTSKLPNIFRNRKTVGIRVPNNDIIRELVDQLGNPILSTTVKDENDEVEYTTNPELIFEKWSTVADIVIDGGIGGMDPSTVVDCTGDEPIIIRQGKGELVL